MGLAYDACLFEHIHEATGTVVTDGELSLDETGGAAATADNQTGSIIEHRVEVVQVHIVGTTLATLATFNDGFWQFEGL